MAKVLYKEDYIEWLQRCFPLLRKVGQISVAEFADTIGVNRQSVYQWEKIGRNEKFETPLGFSQYILIRIIIDYRIEAMILRGDYLLSNVVELLINRYHEYKNPLDILIGMNELASIADNERDRNIVEEYYRSTISALNIFEANIEGYNFPFRKFSWLDRILNVPFDPERQKKEKKGDVK